MRRALAILLLSALLAHLAAEDDATTAEPADAADPPAEAPANPALLNQETFILRDGRIVTGWYDPARQEIGTLTADGKSLWFGATEDDIVSREESPAAKAERLREEHLAAARKRHAAAAASADRARALQRRLDAIDSADAQADAERKAHLAAIQQQAATFTATRDTPQPQPAPALDSPAIESPVNPAPIEITTPPPATPTPAPPPDLAPAPTAPPPAPAAAPRPAPPAARKPPHDLAIGLVLAALTLLVVTWRFFAADPARTPDPRDRP
jgi:hypothetical protein